MFLRRFHVLAVLAILVSLFLAPTVAQADDNAADDKNQPQTKDAGKKDEPKKEEPKKEEPKKEEPKKEEPKKEEKKPEEPKLDPQDQADLALQGEFAGPVATAPSKYDHVALQVRPMGKGSFEAAQYAGGLPGEPAQKQPPVMLLGKRSADFLVLSGGPWAVFVERDHCTLVDREGQKVGRLERVRRSSPTLGAEPPKDALVLFDGHGVEQFTNGRMTDDGLLAEGADLKPMFQDFNMHLEFRLPFMPSARDQGRGNSGVYLQSRYEVQVLDSFAEEPVFNGCGSFYRFRKADVNMCLPPLEWQTYDIQFTAPRWSGDGKKLRNGLITVWHNGVKIQDNVELAGPTGAGKPEEPNLLPIKLQNHGNPVRYRNLWVVDRGIAAGTFPVLAKVESEKKPEPAKESKPAN